MRTRLVDVEVVVVRETPNAVLVRRDGREDGGTWVPKSRCEVAETDRAGVWLLTCERATAEEHGLA